MADTGPGFPNQVLDAFTIPPANNIRSLLKSATGPYFLGLIFISERHQILRQS